jgi:tetratricopeptide (TPR) repeat protein
MSPPGRNEPCSCGSGRRYKACCGRIGGADAQAQSMPSNASLRALVAMLEAGRHADLEYAALELLKQYPDSGVLWQLLGASQRARDIDALPALRRAAELLPLDAAAHNNLANALSGADRLDEAMASYQRALELRPGFLEAHYNLGHALADSGKLEPAIDSYRHAVEINPDFADGWQSLGVVLRDLDRLEEAVACYRRALALAPGDAQMHLDLGLALRLQGRTEQAEQSCRRALELDPSSAATVVVLAEAQADLGRFHEAEALYRRATALEPEGPEAWAGLTRLRRMTPADAGWLAEAQRMAGSGLPPRREVPLRYAIGKYFDDTQDYAQAFENFHRANELTKSYRAPHDRDALRRGVDAVIGQHDPRWLQRRCAAVREADAQSMRPVFIVGMLRSGTSLAEQILASHPQVYGAGELTFWSRAAARLRVAGEPGARELEGLAQEYLAQLAALARDALRVIDKMPANFQHLGLIHAALPNARIIHMRRDPIDTCLSIYFQHFEATHSYATDLEDLAHAYQQYRRLMQHWRQLLPRDVLLEVPYEDLVQQQESWSRRMIAFIGLDWDPRCLEFERTERTVITASKWQVRQKINVASVARWRHYEKCIAPLRVLHD